MNIFKISNGEYVDLQNCSVDDLYRLHYEEESFCAQQILKAPPFSDKRRQILTDGYNIVRPIMQVRSIKEIGAVQSTYGASSSSIDLLKRLIRKKMRSEAKPLSIYEIGIGTGFAAKAILDVFGSGDIFYRGCDIVLDTQVKELLTRENVEFSQGHIFDCIRELTDESIDVLYADNVLEHLLPDEAPQIYSEIVKKLKPGALLFLLIPNKLFGPHDISGKFLPMGTSASGFHFMEMCFGEVTELLAQYGVHHAFSVFRIPRIKHLFLCKAITLLTWFKLRIERILARLRNRKIVQLISSFCGLSVYVMRKD